MNKNFLLTIIIILIFALNVFAQDQKLNLDDLFSQARQLAFDGKRLETISLCQQILNSNPNYHDARVLLGRVYSWESNYLDSRKELKLVLDLKSDYEDARNALIDVELWSDNPIIALNYCDEGLAINPNSASLYFKKARALKALNRIDEAKIAIKKSLELDSTNTDAVLLSEQLKNLSLKNTLQVEFSSDVFDKTFDPWQTVSFSLNHSRKNFSIINRINYSHRFNRSAVQYEIDAYPKIKDGTYAYLNVGLSTSNIFPKVRTGAELYHNFSKGVEASIGFRYLRFSSNVFIYTGSISKYYKNYLISFRPFVTPGDIGTSSSASVLLRRYFDDPNSFVSFSFGAGSAPNEQFTSEELFRLSSRRLGIDFQKVLSKTTITLMTFGFDRQEIMPNSFRQRYTFSIGIQKKF